MIIGEDLTHELGIKIYYRMGSITWDGMTRPMRSVNTDRDNLKLTREEHHQSDTLKRALNHQEEELDIISTPVETQKLLQEAKHLTQTEKLKLGKVLNRRKDMLLSQKKCIANTTQN